MSELRQRRSAKWSTVDEGVLPMHVAEMDVHLAEPVRAALDGAVRLGDTGYAGEPSALSSAFAMFAARRWGWRPDGTLVRLCGDVAAGATELLRVLLSPGERVVITPPVYPPFRAWISAARAVALETPLRPDSGALDLPAIDRALALGARVVLLCHPHNPTGRVHHPEELDALASMAERHGATVVSDEILAPLTHPGRDFVPYLSVSAAAARTGLALHSASKAWNLAGLKAALLVAGDRRCHQHLLAQLPHEFSWSAGHLGALASTAAYAEGEEWLDGLLVGIAANFGHLRAETETRLPDIRWHRPEAGFVAWLDLGGTVSAVDVVARWREDARVETTAGTDFGVGGEGHIRLNVACSPHVLSEAINRIAAL